MEQSVPIQPNYRNVGPVRIELTESVFRCDSISNDFSESSEQQVPLLCYKFKTKLRVTKISKKKNIGNSTEREKREGETDRQKDRDRET